ncbi:ferric siderophore transport system, periplasmic binding protein TonB [Vibrio sp. JCM 19052]|nr:energy transducer TonB [Vibrio owensii]AQW60064.1 energy transducer TonB [Vibrio owensii]GAK22647.1 ferric siderophore transport system, periplasmic binding protein TonB [Vibrio sp. JCM 19052]
MPAGNPTSSVSLNLVSAPKPVQAEPTPQEVVEEKQPEPQKKPQPKPEPKPVKKTVEKPIVKKEAIKKKPVEKKPKPVKKPQTSKPVAKKDPQPKEKVEKKVAKEPVPQQKAAPTEQSKGATSQPVMIDQPAFVSQPVQPRYPRSARKRGIEGVALYEVWLDENGNQVKQVLIESSGAEMLDVSALRAIKQWQFSPHISGGQKVAHRVQIPVRFKLDG